jgi:hypothetical protein
MEKMSDAFDAALLEEFATLKREAVEKTGFDDFGDPVFEAPLTAWVHDLINGNINDFGRQFLQTASLNRTVTRITA